MSWSEGRPGVEVIESGELVAMAVNIVASGRFSSGIEDWRGIDRVDGSSIFRSLRRYRSATYSGTHVTPRYKLPVPSAT
jgi:hypothetical protein